MADSFYAAAAVVTFRLDSFSPECKLQHLYPRDIFERQIMWLVLPCGFALVYVVIYGIVLCLRALIVQCGCTVRGRYLGYCGMLRMLTLPFPKLNATFVSGFSRLAISGYPVLVSHALRTMQCVSLEDGVVVLNDSFGARCYDDNWFGWLWTSIVGMILYGIGIPAGLYLLMVASREAAAMRVAEVKHQNRAKRIVELVREARTPVARGGATPLGASASAGAGAAAARGADAAGRPEASAEAALDAAPQQHPPDREMNGGPYEAAAASPGHARPTSERQQSTSSFDQHVDAYVDDPPSRVKELIGRVAQALGTPKASDAPQLLGHASRAAGPSATSSRTTGAEAAKLQQGVRPAPRSEAHSPPPSPPADDSRRVHLFDWKSSKASSAGQSLGLRLAGIPDHVVLRATQTPGVDEGLSARVRERTLQGSTVVTHDELEQWRDEDLKHARENTSDVLVDADHLLWPFIVDYREDAYYWSLVEMAEFALIVLATTFVTDPVSQMSLMLLSILAFMLLVIVNQPFRSDFFNRVELFNDGLQILSLVVGISFVREPRPISEEASDVLLLVMISANLVNLASSIVRDVSDKVDDWKRRSFWGSWRVAATARSARRAKRGGRSAGGGKQAKQRAAQAQVAPTLIVWDDEGETLAGRSACKQDSSNPGAQAPAAGSTAESASGEALSGARHLAAAAEKTAQVPTAQSKAEIGTASARGSSSSSRGLRGHARLHVDTSIGNPG